MAGWIDQRDAAGPGRRGRRFRDQHGRMCRERDADQVAMDADDSLDLIAGEREDHRVDATRSPTPVASGLPGHPLIPTELPFQAAQIVEPRLDLDHEQRARARVERKKVDPRCDRPWTISTSRAVSQPRFRRRPST
jgi:hypothetical protein